MVYKEEAAQSASAFSNSRELAGTFQVSVTARKGTNLSRMEREVYEEIGRLATDGPTPEELQAAKNGIESSFVFRLASTLGKANQLNDYNTFRGKANLFNEDLARSRAVTAADIKRVASQYLVNKPKVVLSIVPNGHADLAAQPTEATP
jgi:zinc protease